MARTCKLQPLHACPHSLCSPPLTTPIHTVSHSALPALDRVDTALRTHLDHNLQCQLSLQGLCQPQAHGGDLWVLHSPPPQSTKVEGRLSYTHQRTNTPTPGCWAEQPSRLSLNLMVPPRDYAGGGERVRWERRGKNSRKQRCMRKAQPALREKEQ